MTQVVVRMKRSRSMRVLTTWLRRFPTPTAVLTLGCLAASFYGGLVTKQGWRDYDRRQLQRPTRSLRAQYGRVRVPVFFQDPEDGTSSSSSSTTTTTTNSYRTINYWWQFPIYPDHVRGILFLAHCDDDENDDPSVSWWLSTSHAYYHPNLDIVRLARQLGLLVVTTNHNHKNHHHHHNESSSSSSSVHQDDCAQYDPLIVAQLLQHLQHEHAHRRETDRVEALPLLALGLVVVVENDDDKAINKDPFPPTTIPQLPHVQGMHDFLSQHLPRALLSLPPLGDGLHEQQQHRPTHLTGTLHVTGFQYKKSVPEQKQQQQQQQQQGLQIITTKKRAFQIRPQQKQREQEYGQPFCRDRLPHKDDCLIDILISTTYLEPPRHGRDFRPQSTEKQESLAYPNPLSGVEGAYRWLFRMCCYAPVSGGLRKRDPWKTTNRAGEVAHPALREFDPNPRGCSVENNNNKRRHCNDIDNNNNNKPYKKSPRSHHSNNKENCSNKRKPMVCAKN